ncbi:fibroblast growth factor receptor 4-like isoform X2 [Acanthaster planci]|uniref:receptor protein-tyrosine kinase n=1 Tax=Acanthaster planci TaxID=133434 RepID=A0A8B7ZNL8_ACAPL|nr:fibroblast growth factor receptor 4-like isoform X2 [Acanthaster planci]
MLFLLNKHFSETGSVHFNCTFEDGMCGWAQSRDDDSDWSLNSGGTTSSNTGPSTDSTRGDASGVYVYYEATGGGAGDTAVLLSPVMHSIAGFCFGFSYNMYGDTMGTLNVYQVPFNGNISEGEIIFTRSGQQTTAATWLSERICLRNVETRFKIALQAERGSNYKPDIAIDDLSAEDFSTPILLWDPNTIFPPLGGISHAVAGNDQTYICQVPRLQDPASLKWTVDWQEVTATRNSSLQDDSGLYTSTSILTLPAADIHQGQIVQCYAQTDDHGLLSTTVMTHVKVPPSQTSLSLYGSSGALAARVSLVEGEPYSFLCTVRQTRPAATIRWLLDENDQRTDPPPSGDRDTLMDTTSSWTLVPSRANHGQRVKCAASTAESQSPLPSVTATLDVTGPPDSPTISGLQSVTENERIQLRCQARRGYPDDWELVWSDEGSTLAGSLTTAISTSGSRFTFTSMLNFELSREDDGRVINCTARRRGSSQRVTASLGPINVHYHPYLSEPVAPGPVWEGDDVILSCSADANPKPANFIIWEKVGSFASLPSVYSDGTSTLTLLNISREQAGPYRCRGDNGVPPLVHSSHINLTVRFKPYPPLDVSIQQGRITTESLTVKWTPGSEGGEKQWFYVSYSETGYTGDSVSAIRSVKLYNVSEYTLVGLRPDTEYEVEVYAENANGASEAVKTLGTTLRPLVTTCLYLVGIGALTLLLFISTVINLTQCYRSKNTRQKPSKKETQPQSVSERKAGTRVSSRVVEDMTSYENVAIPMQTVRARVVDPVESTYHDTSDCQATISRDQLIFVRELNQGAFFKLLLARAKGIERSGVVTPVALKTVKDETDQKERQNLIWELKSMKSLTRHSNIVQLLGYCIEKDPMYIILEYTANGTLKELLADHQSQSEAVYDNLRGAADSSLTPQTLLSLAKGVADGMAFLASHACLHKDLAACNVYVGDGMVSKLSDFGFVSDVAHMRKYQRQNQGCVPLRWMALESVRDDVYTTESDVWSFGILLWEIVTLGCKPYPTMSAEKVAAKLKSGYRMPRPSHCHTKVYQLMLACWARNPSARPTFATVGEKLGKLMGKANEYISLEGYQGHLYKANVADG